MRTFIRAVAVASALVVASLGTASAAQAAAFGRTEMTQVAEQEVLLVNRGTGRCLDAFYSEGGGNGNRVGLWDCNGGITEVWRLSTVSTGTFPYRLVNARSGRCLDYPAESGGAIGWQFKLWDCNGSASQNLALVPQADGFYKIYMQRNGAAPMDAYSSDGGGNGNRVGIWNETGSALQHWTLRWR